MAQPKQNPRFKDMLGHDTQETSIDLKLFLNLRLVPQAPLKTLMMVGTVIPSVTLQRILSLQSKSKTSLTWNWEWFCYSLTYVVAQLLMVVGILQVYQITLIACGMSLVFLLLEVSSVILYQRLNSLSPQLISFICLLRYSPLLAKVRQY